MPKYNFHGKRMHVIQTAPGGVVNEETYFHFQQAGDRVWASYKGGRVERGSLVGLLHGNSLRFRYVQQGQDGVVDGGESKCDLDTLADGRLVMVEHFEWGSRVGRGSNVFEELAPNEAYDSPAGEELSTYIEAIHPVLMSRDLGRSITFYKKLGFEVRFRDDATDTRYACVGRDAIELHLQWHSSEQWIEGQDRPTTRFLVRNPDELRRSLPADNMGGKLRPVFDTPWGTREFHVRDPDGNGLQFYRLR